MAAPCAVFPAVYNTSSDTLSVVPFLALLFLSLAVLYECGLRSQPGLFFALTLLAPGPFKIKKKQTGNQYAPLSKLGLACAATQL